MANLGTLDRTRFGLTGIANTIAQNAVKNGNEWDKLAALIGGYVGDRMGQHKRKKQEAKLDDIVAQAKSNPNDTGFTVGSDGSIVGTGNGLSQQDYNYVMNGQEPAIGMGTVDNPTQILSPEVTQAIQSANAQQAPAVAQGYNPNYNMDYIREQARKQGISSGVLADREDAIKRDIAQSADAYYLPQIQKKLYGSKDAPATTDSILEGMNMLNELGRYSPETAKAYQALAVNGLQGNQKFNQPKELAEINARNQAIADARRFQNRLDYRNITQNNKNQNGGKVPTNADKMAASKGIRTILDKYAVLDEDGKPTGKYLPITDAYDKQELERLHGIVNYTGTQNNVAVGNGPSQIQRTANDTTGTQPEKSAGKVSDSVRRLAEGIDYNDFNSLNENGLAMVKLMQDNGVSFDKAMEAVGSKFYSMVKQGKLNKDDYRTFMGNYKTKEELNDEAIVEIDKKLHPDKYGIDPLGGLKNFFSGKFDDEKGRKLREDYLAKG